VKKKSKAALDNSKARESFMSQPMATLEELTDISFFSNQIIFSNLNHSLIDLNFFFYFFKKF
jgi:hypothetical protein